MEFAPPLIGKNMRALPPKRKNLGLAPSVAAHWAQDSWSKIRDFPEGASKGHVELGPALWEKKFESFPQGVPKGGSLHRVELGPALVGENMREFPPGSA
jgi:hypothetical protein